MGKATIEIGPDGEVTVDLRGYRGKACEKVMEEIMKAVGAKSCKTSNKPEHALVTQDQKLRIQR